MHAVRARGIPRSARHWATPTNLLRQPAGHVTSVVTLPGRIEIAALLGDHVELSRDGGAAFAPILERAGFPHVVLDCAGQLYAARDGWLGTRTVDGAETWQPFPFATAGKYDALYDVAGVLAWFHGDAVAVSSDRAATWHRPAAAVERALAAADSYHRFVVAGRELELARFLPGTELLALVRFDPRLGTATDEPVDVTYRNDLTWIAARHGDHRWQVSIRCRSKPTANGGEDCVPAPEGVDRDDLRAVAGLLPRVVGGSSPRDLPVAWCRSAWSGGLDCALLTVRDGVVSREPYTSNGGYTGRRLPATPTIGFALPSSFGPGWPVAFDGDGHTIAMFDGYLMRWSDAAGWRVLPIGVDGATQAALTAASTPVDANPDDHPLAQALRAGFGARVWRCDAGTGDCAVALRDVRCTAARCDAIDHGDGNRAVHATGSGAAAVRAELTADLARDAVAIVECGGHRHLPAYNGIHCRMIATAGDDAIDTAIAPFEMSSLGQHMRTPTPVRIACTVDACVLATSASQRVALAGDDAAALARALVARRGERAGVASCESIGGSADGGLTWTLACSLTAP